MSRRVAINLVAFLAMFALALWWSVNNIITVGFVDPTFEVKAEFAAAAGVAPASEVAYLGVNYGSVSAVESLPGKVLVTMSIRDGERIPANSIARIYRKSAIGEPYIDFSPPEDFDGELDDVLEDGDMVPMERTTVPLEFSELLRSASRVLGSVEPEQTRTLVHELAAALDGRGDDLRGLTVDSDALLARLADRSELLDSLSANSTRLTRTFTEHRGSLSSSVQDLASLAESLRKVDPSTDVLLSRGTELLALTADLVSDVKKDLDCVLTDLDAAITELTSEANLGHLEYVLENGPTNLGLVFQAKDEEPGGVWVRVNLQVNPANPPEQYAPPRELPAVPTVPACDSSLVPSSSVAAVASTDSVLADLSPKDSRDRRAAAVPAIAASGLVGYLIVRRRRRA